jgi:hypothetical protein
MLYNYFLRNSKLKNSRLVIALLISTVLSIFVMQKFDSYLISEASPYGIGSFELAKDITKSIRIIETWDTNKALSAAGFSLGFDFVFILSYTFFLALLVFLVSKHHAQAYTRFIAQFLIGTMLLAALIDIIENTALINLLLGNYNQLWATIAFYAAVPKFLIILLSIVFIFSRFILSVIRLVLKY